MSIVQAAIGKLVEREDLVCGGSHKLNNSLGQALLARRMGKSRLITETAAGQHGLSVAMAGNVLGMEVEVFMGRRISKGKPAT